MRHESSVERTPRCHGAVTAPARPARTACAVTAIAACVLLAAACAVPPRQQPLDARVVVPSAGEKVAVSQVVLVFDSSSSIDAARYFPPAKALLESFVAGMPDGAYAAGGVIFGGTTAPFESQGRFDRARFVESAKGVPYIGGPTPIDEGLGLADNALRGRQGRAAVVLFSDGAPTRGSTPESTLAAAESIVANHKGPVCFHVLRTGNDPSGEPLLRKIAELTDCGSLRTIDSVAAVEPLHTFQRAVFLEGTPAVAARPAAPPAVAAGPVSDRDSDGVVDVTDECPRTPLGAKVDSRGCWRLSGVLFAFDRADIRPQYRAVLDEVVAVIKANTGARVRLEGHTDGKGSDSYNQSLSERRAQSVLAYLVAAGVDPRRLEAIGFGEQKPIATNDTEDGRLQNRRLELSPVE
jgi:OmpA-OmpF porin, OOP family